MTTTTQTSLGKVLAFLDRIEKEHLAYSLKHVRETIMVVISIPGERWEVEFFEDGEIEIERFVSTGVEGVSDEVLEQLIADHSD